MLLKMMKLIFRLKVVGMKSVFVAKVDLCDGI